MSHRRNVLLLSAGRRVSLARAFRAACDEAGVRFLTADLAPERSAACQDNRCLLRLPHVLDPGYGEALARLCREDGIGVVVPTIDTELATLSRLRDAFLADGTALIVSDTEIIDAARDKRASVAFFDRFGVRSPRLYADAGSVFYPAIAKPFDGSLSRDFHILSAAADLTPRIAAIPNVMFAEYLDHACHDEFTCDAYYDRGGLLRCVVPRQRLEVRGGEVSKAATRRNAIVDLFHERLASLPGARGCLTFQFFMNRQTGALSLIELNPRFGGGYPLSDAAGAHYPDWIVREYCRGEVIASFGGWTADLMMLRFDGEVIVPAGPGKG